MTKSADRATGSKPETILARPVQSSAGRRQAPEAAEPSFRTVAKMQSTAIKVVDRFVPLYPLEKVGNEWVGHAPGSDITFPREPLWFRAIDDMNAVLDQSADPVALKRLHDEVLSLADSLYAATNRVDATRVASVLARATSRVLLTELDRLFAIHLGLEERSTLEIGGAMAGSLCSQMIKYRTIAQEISRRLSQLESPDANSHTRCRTP